jgi:hypothetical protein
VDRTRTFKAAGIALLLIGAAMVFVGLEGGGPAFRIGGPALGFMGVVLLAQAKDRG